MAQFIVKQGAYGTFRTGIENAPHGMLHVYIGGDNGDLTQMHSPNDPLFFMFHASLDRMWYLWQALDTTTRLKDYGGASLTASIPGYSTKTVGQMLNYQQLCLSYQDYSGDTVISLPGLRARLAAGAESPTIFPMGDVTDCLPKPLPDKWLNDNQLNPKEARGQESDFHVLVSKSPSSKACASGNAVSVVSVTETNNDTINAIPTPSDGTSQGVRVTTTTTNGVPGWAVGVIVLGACILVLMIVLVFVFMSRK
jgi:hypothetical protein